MKHFFKKKKFRIKASLTLGSFYKRLQIVIATALKLSLLSTPCLHVNASNLTALFEPPDRADYSEFSLRVLRFLPIADLFVMWRVSQKCQGLAEQVWALQGRDGTIPLSYGQHHHKLLSTLLKIIQAEEDWSEQAPKIFSDLKKHFPGPSPDNLEALQKRLLPAESLILRDDTVLHSLLTDAVLTSSHPALSPLQGLITTLKDRNNVYGGMLKPLIAFYGSYLDRLVTSPPSDRPALLRPKILFKIRGLKFSYRISSDLAQQLISQDAYGLVFKRDTTGNHKVFSQGGVHFKSNTGAMNEIHPEMERALNALSYALGFRAVTPAIPFSLENVILKKPSPEFPQTCQDYEKARNQGLSSIEFFTEHPASQSHFKETPTSHLVQGSQTVLGETLQTYLEKTLELPLEERFQDLDRASFSQAILFALLTNPRDGKPDNYIVTFAEEKGKRQVIGIDNDDALAYPIVAIRCSALPGKPVHHYNDLKTALYSLPLMDEPVDEGVREAFLALSPELAVLQALALMKEVDSESTLKLTPRFASEMAGRMHTLQKKLTDQLYSLLRHLFACLYPLNAAYYSVMREAHPQDALRGYRAVHHDNPEGLDKQDRGYKKLSLEEALTGPVFLNKGQTIEEALAPFTHSPHSFDTDRTHSVDEVIKEYVEGFSWKALKTSFERITFLKTLLIHFPKHMPLVSRTLPSEILDDAFKTQAPFYVFKFLTGQLQKIDTRNEKGETLLHRAVTARISLDVIPLLIRKGVPLEAEDRSGHTALDNALVPAWPEGFKLLIQKGASQVSPTLAVKFYRSHVKKSPHFQEAFAVLEARHQHLRWYMSLDRCLPGTKPKGETSEVIQSARGGPRFLPERIRKQILTDKGQWIPYQASDTNHIVARASHGKDTLFFKVAPELPGLEAAVGILTQKLLSFGVPYSDVFLIRGMPVLVSQGIEGQTLAWHLASPNAREILSSLDPPSVFGLILAAMLVNPEDGKPANYIVEPFIAKDGTQRTRLIGIDNDHAFVPAVVRERPEKTLVGKLIPTAQVKTILFCLDQMKQPIDPETKTCFINQKLDVSLVPLDEGKQSLDPETPTRQMEVYLFPWLKELRHVHRSLSGLVNERAFWRFYQEDQIYLGVPFRQGAVRHLYDKHRKMMEYLTQNPACTPLGVLYALEPYLAKRYDRAFEGAPKSVLERFKLIDQAFYETSSTSRGSQTTVTRSQDILKSMEIHFEEKTAAILKEGKMNSPEGALKELEEAHEEYEQLRLGTLAIRLHDPEFWVKLKLVVTCEKVLETIDFATLSGGDQESILQALQIHTTLSALSLHNCFRLRDSHFTGILPLRHLVKVDLRGCSQVGSPALVALSTQAPGLQELNLAFHQNLLTFGEVGVFTTNPLTFLNLRWLNLAECPKLQSLLAIVPQLQWLSVEGCLKLTDQGLDSLVRHIPSLQVLKLEGCALITEKDMRARWPSYPAALVRELKNPEAIRKILSHEDQDPYPNLFLWNTKEVDATPLGIKILAQALSLNTTLRELDLRDNSIGDAGAQALSLNTTLTKLNLGNNKINAVDAALFMWNQIGDIDVQALSLKTLLKLNLRDNKIGVAGAQALALNTSLRELDLGGNKIGVAGAQALALNTTLRELDLGGNKIGDAGAQALSLNTTLRELDLGNNKIRDFGAQALALNTTLTKLALWASQIGDAGAQALSLNTTLTSLNLGSNKIEDAGAQALAKNTTLRELNLGWNRIGDFGAQALCCNTTLTKLNLERNPIGEAGAQILSLNTTLTSLNLCENLIGDAGAQALAQNTTLRELNLGWNRIGDFGAQALSRNTTLAKMNLCDNLIGDAGAQALSLNTTLTSLNLERNPIREAGKEALRQSKNPHLRNVYLF